MKLILGVVARTSRWGESLCGQVCDCWKLESYCMTDMDIHFEGSCIDFGLDIFLQPAGQGTSVPACFLSSTCYRCKLSTSCRMDFPGTNRGLAVTQ